MARKNKAKEYNDEELQEATRINGWLARIKMAEGSQKEADDQYGFSRATREYQGDFASAMPTFISDADIVPINEVFAFVKTFTPSVYSRDPHISVNPQGYKSIPGAKIMELFINAYWRELNLKREVRRIIVDACLAEGWVKCGYTSALGSIKKEDEAKPGLESNEYIQSDEIFAARVSWKNIIRDPGSINGAHDARWIAERIIKPLEAVKNSSLYENTEDLKPSFLISNKLPGSYSDQRKKPIAYDDVPYVVLWEIWDRDTNTVCTIAEGCEKYLMEKEWPYEMDGFPYVMLRFNENPDETYSPNLICSWEPQLWEKIKIRAMELDHLKRFNRQLSIEQDSMTRKEIDKLTLGKTGSITTRKKGAAPPMPIPYPPLQTDVYAIENRIDLDKDNISGQPNAVRSAPQKTQSRTLGEINTMISAFSSRQTEPQSIIEDFCEEIAMKLLKISQQFMRGDKYVRATQKDVREIITAFTDPETGEKKFDGSGFRFSRKDIEDIDFEVDVKSGSTLPMNRENIIDSCVNILKLGPTIGIIPGGNVSRVIGKTLFSNFDMKEIEQAYEEDIRQIDAQKALTLKQQEISIEQNKQKIANLKAGGPEGMAAMAELRGGGGGQPAGGGGNGVR